MKKILINILVICFIFSSVSAGAAYTVSGTTVSGVPLFTTAEELCQNAGSIPNGQVVVKSADSAYDTLIYKKSFVDESCFIKSGKTYYSIRTIAPFLRKDIGTGTTYNITDMMNTGNNIAVSFSLTPDENFSKQTVFFRITGIKNVFFEIGNDSFASVIDGKEEKVRLERVGTDRTLLTELFWKRSGDTLLLEYLYINGEKITPADAPQLPAGTGNRLLVGYESEDSALKLSELNVMCVTGYETQFKNPGLSLTDSDGNIYRNYGVNNIDAVYLGQNSTDSLDAVFGSEITVENNKLTVNNILTKDTYECTLLEKLPELSKVRLFKNGAQLFALESGNIRVERDIPTHNVIFMACYDSNNLLKQVSSEKSVTFRCNSGDTVKVFILDAYNTIVPVTVAAQINKDGIFQNDGYEK